MPTVADILKNKGVDVTTVTPETTVLEAARRMNEQRIGCVVVTVADHIAGVFSERDVLQRVVADGRDPATTRVEEMMTHEVVCCNADMTVDEARKTFRSRRVRHLPVVDVEGRLKAMISIGDLNAFDLDGQAVEIAHLHEYIYGLV